MKTPIEVKTTAPAETGHWYTRSGEPCYTVIGTNGKERPTTLRDARKLDLVPSTTGITKLMDKPGLANWIGDQLIKAALTVERGEDSDESYIARIKEAANEIRDKAAERGTALHGDIEKFLLGQPHGHEAHVKAIREKLAAIGIDLASGDPERSFAHPDGFGGKIDWSRSDGVVLDFKSKECIERKTDGKYQGEPVKKLAYEEHFIQLASYGRGLGFTNPTCYNVFVGIDDYEVEIVKHSEDDLARGLAMFGCLLKLWKIKNRIQ